MRNVDSRFDVTGVTPSCTQHVDFPRLSQGLHPEVAFSPETTRRQIKKRHCSGIGLQAGAGPL